MPASKVSVDVAKPDKLFYFVCTVIPFRKDDGKCLILKRAEREKVHPGKWGTVGGQAGTWRLRPEEPDQDERGCH